MNNQPAIAKTQQWLIESVIKYRFCPYAQQPYEKNTIGYHVYSDDNILTLLEALGRCCLELDAHSTTLPNTTLPETTLLVIANDDNQYLADFYDYLDVLDVANDFLENPQQFVPHFSAEFQSQHKKAIPTTWGKHYQLASFHPDYQFDNATADDRENYTNRSPYPIFHLLRNDAIEHVRINDKQAEKITTRNITTLNNLSDEAFQLLQTLAGHPR